MTYRVQLQITGEAADAKAAVRETEADLKRLGQTAQEAGKKLRDNLHPPAQPSEAIKLTQQQLAQMQFQVNDMATGLVSGQSPFTVMMQQGLQLSQMFTSGTGVMGALKAVGGGIVTFLTNPMNLAVVGFGLLATAAAAAFDAILSRGSGVGALLDEHEAMIKRIGAAWDGARGKAKDYSGQTSATLLSTAISEGRSLERQFTRLQQDTYSRALYNAASGNAVIGSFDLKGNFNGVSQREVADTGSAELMKLFNALYEGLKTGKADIKAFADEVARLSNASGDPRIDSIEERLRAGLQPLIDMQEAVSQNRDVVKGFQGDQKLLNQSLGEGAARARDMTSAVNGLAKGMGEAFARGERMFQPGQGAAASPAMAGKSFLDFLAAAEGTDFDPARRRGRGYNETLGYGAFTGGNVELVTMTLREVIALQGRMLAHPDNRFNSSALGRYQITRETLTDFMPKLGLSMDDVFTPALQDKIALTIAATTKGDPRLVRGRWAGTKRFDDGVIAGAWNNSLPDVSGAAQGMADEAAQKRAADIKGYQKAIADATRQDEEFAAVIAKRGAEMDLASRMIGKTADEQEKLRFETQAWADAQRVYGDRLKEDPALFEEVSVKVRQLTAEFIKLRDAQQQESARSRVAAAEWNRQAAMKSYQQEQQISLTKELANAGQGMGTVFVQAFQQSRSASEAWGATLDSVLGKLTGTLDKLIDKGLNALLDMIGGFTTQAVFDANGGFYAKGGGFDGITAFAAGGSFANSIVSRPTLFRYGADRLGMMGEAGPEAILPLNGNHEVRAKFAGGESALPLTRLSDGALGIDLRSLASPVTGFAKGDAFGSAGSAGTGLARAPVINNTVKNYGGEKVEQKASQRADGTIDLETVVGNMVNRKIADGAMDETMTSRFKMRRRVGQYG